MEHEEINFDNPREVLDTFERHIEKQKALVAELDAQFKKFKSLVEEQMAKSAS